MVEFNQNDYMLLRVNLKDKKAEKEQIPEKVIKKYIGGKGIGSKYLLEEIKPNTDPLGPDNKIFLVTGPLTGTIFPTSNRYGILYKSPLTGGYAESYSGGNVGRNIRFAGYFMIIIENASQSPIYLDITNEGAIFHDASDLWGLDTIEVTERLTEEKRRDLDLLCIGPAGENMVHIASVQNNKYHSAGRCGPGAVMGSKKLKAIRFMGKKKVALDKEKQFRDFVLKKIYKAFKDKPELYGKEGAYRMLGTPSIVDWANELGCFPTRYFSKGYSEYADKINDQALIDSILKKRTGCVNCPFGCGKYVEVEDDGFECKTEGPEYETIALVGGACDIHNIGAIAKINDFCDRMGIDTISAGSLAGLAIESISRGKISEIDGIDLTYNNAKSVLKFLEMLVYRKGIGDDFANGTKFVEKKYDLQDFAMHVKGLDFAGYDPRQFRGFTLSYGVSPEGPTHLRSNYQGIEKNMPYEQRLSYEGKAEPMIEQEDKLALLDSFILCKFVRFGIDWELLVDTYNIIFNESINKRGLREIADNIVTMSRVFNVREGFTRDDDYMPKRAYREYLEAPDGKKTKLDWEKYDKMLDEYYELRNWDENGIPKRIKKKSKDF